MVIIYFVIESLYILLFNLILDICTYLGTIGSGSFIGTVLTADFFRASAYIYTNYYPRKTVGDRLQLTIVRRPSFRLIENHERFIQRINQVLLDYVSHSLLCHM